MTVLPSQVRIDVSEANAAGYRIYARRLIPPLTPKATVVLVHGMVVAGRGMLPLARALADRGLDVHLPDLPGFGRSDKPDRALDVPGLGRVLNAWIQSQIAEPKIVVVGNSFGTQVAAAASAAAGDREAPMVLVAPTIDARFKAANWTSHLPPGRPATGVKRGIAGRLHQSLSNRLIADQADPAARSLRRLLVSEYVAAGPARALSTYRHALRDDLLATLAGVRAPLVVVRGAHDGVVSNQWATRVASARPDGQLIEVAGVDHDGQFNEPQLLADVLVNEVLPTLNQSTDTP